MDQLLLSGKSDCSTLLCKTQDLRNYQKKPQPPKTLYRSAPSHLQQDSKWNVTQIKITSNSGGNAPVALQEIHWEGEGLEDLGIEDILYGVGRKPRSYKIWMKCRVWWQTARKWSRHRPLNSTLEQRPAPADTGVRSSRACLEPCL